MPAKRASGKKKKVNTRAHRRRKVVRRKPAREYEPDLPSDERVTLAEKLLLGEELAQYVYGGAGSYTVGFD